MTPRGPIKVGIFLFDEVEVLDFCGPFEVFGVAGSRRVPRVFDVVTIAQAAGPINARNGLVVQPHFSFADAPHLDILLVPGGQGSRRELHNSETLAWVTRAAKNAELVLSVCTGALILAKAGLLDGLEATTHHASLDLLGELAPRTKVRRDRRFVDNGKVITSAGIAAGIDMSLYVVERLVDAELARATARQMEYPYGEAN